MAAEPVMFAKNTLKHAVKVVWSPQFGMTLVLDGEQQLSEADESIYHTHLVLPALIASFETQALDLDVLILGGADGFSLRKVLSNQNIRTVTLVDHDQELVQLFAHGELGKLFGTGAAFTDPRVKVIFADAFEFLSSASEEKWHTVIIDLTDDWLNKAASLFAAIQAVQHERGTIVSMSAGSTTRKPSVVDTSKRTRLIPISQWEVDIPSYRERWILFLCATSNWTRQDLANLLPRASRRWLLT